MELANKVNEYVDQKQPWELAKQPERAAELHAVCSVTLEAFRLLTAIFHFNDLREDG